MLTASAAAISGHDWGWGRGILVADKAADRRLTERQQRMRARLGREQRAQTWRFAQELRRRAEHRGRWPFASGQRDFARDKGNIMLPYQSLTPQA